MNIDKGLIEHWKMLFESEESRQNGEESLLQTEENRAEEEDYTFQRWKSDTENDGKTSLDARNAISDVFKDTKVLKLIGDIFWELIDENHQILDDVVTKLKGDAISRLVNVYGNDRNTIDKLSGALTKLKNSNKSSNEIQDKWNKPTKPDEIYESR